MSMASSNAIPHEIWAEIFGLAEDEDNISDDSRSSEFERGTFYDTASVPWLPSQVCHRWRTICHSTPSLWAQIVVRSRRILRSKSPLGKPAGHEWIGLMLKKRLEFARTCPLRIYVYGTLLREPVEDIIMEALWPYRTSWEHAHLEFANQARKRWIDIALRPAEPSEEPDQFPFLQHLSLSFDTSHRHFPEQFLALTSHSHTPALTSAHLQGIHANISLPLIHAGFWSRLRHLTLTFARGRDPPPVFPLLENVERLELRPHAAMFNADSTSPTSPIYSRDSNTIHILPFLQDLTLRVSGSTVIHHLLAPRLTSLSLTFNFNPEVLLPFIQRSRCAASLTRLVGYEVSFWSLRNVLHALPMLDELKLFGMAPTQLKSTVQCLLGDELTLTPVCPKLRVLVLKEWQAEGARYHVHDEEMVEALTSMLNARWGVTNATSLDAKSATSLLPKGPRDLLPERVQLQVAQLVMQGSGSMERLTDPLVQQIRLLADEGMDVDIVWLDQKAMERVSFVFVDWA